MATRIPTKNPAPVQALERHLRGEETRRIRPIVRIVHCSTRRRDLENQYGSVKGLVDCLRYAGLIADDSEEAIDLRVSRIKVETRKEHGTYVQIEYP